MLSIESTTDTTSGRSGEAKNDHGIGLRWLVSLRWGAVAAQALAVVAARLLFDARLDLVPLLGLFAFAAATNVGLASWLRKGTPSRGVVTLTLLTDVALLSILLHASGGPSNPFSILYLVQVALAAILLDSASTWLVVTAACAGYGLLFLMPYLGASHVHGGHAAMAHGSSGGEFASHLQGMWLAFTTAAVLVGYFVGRLASALRARDEQLAAARELATRHERVAALTTLAAGAAHELGTPLGTIAIVASELERGAESLECAAPLRDDVRLIRAEVERCRSILQRLSEQAGETPGEAPESVSLAELLSNVRDSSTAPTRVQVRCQVPGDLVVAPPRALGQVVGSLVQNALDAAPADTAVTLDATMGDRGVEIRVRDRGAGMDERVLARAGEPFFTTKPSGRGLGLGLFLARAFAERLGGKLTIRSLPQLGTTVELELPSSRAST